MSCLRKKVIKIRRIATAKFLIDGKTYLAGIEVGVFKVKDVYIGKQLETNNELLRGKLVSGIKVEWENTSILESFGMWLVDLKRYLVKKRRQKRNKSGRCNSRDRTRRNIGQK